jgi:hypothetical protein
MSIPGSPSLLNLAQAPESHMLPREDFKMEQRLASLVQSRSVGSQLIGWRSIRTCFAAECNRYHLELLPGQLSGQCNPCDLTRGSCVSRKPCAALCGGSIFPGPSSLRSRPILKPLPHSKSARTLPRTIHCSLCFCYSESTMSTASFSYQLTRDE